MLQTVWATPAKCVPRLYWPPLAHFEGDQRVCLGPGRGGGGCPCAPQAREASRRRGDAAAAMAPPALAVAMAPSRRREVGICLFEHVGVYGRLRTAARRRRASGRRVRIDYPIDADRVLGLGVPPTVRLQRGLSTPGTINRFERVLVLVSLDLVRRAPRSRPVHARPPSRSFSVRGGEDVCGVRYRGDLLLGDPDRAAVVRGASRSPRGRRRSRVRRMMIEYGEVFWGDAGPPSTMFLEGIRWLPCRRCTSQRP